MDILFSIILIVILTVSIVYLVLAFLYWIIYGIWSLIDSIFRPEKRCQGFIERKDFTPAQDTYIPISSGVVTGIMPYNIPADYQVIVKVKDIGYGSISVKDSFYSSISVGDLVYIRYSTGRFSKSLYLWNIWQ